MNRLGKLVFLPVVGLLLSSAPAAAYVRTLNGSGKPIRWADSCISLVAHTNNATAPLYAAGMMKALNGAAAMWGRPSYTCTPLTLSVTEEPKMPGIVTRDKTNRVLILTDRWCRQSGESNAPCYSRATLAITTITAYTSGTISEADIEVNAVNFSWDDRAARPLAHGQDLQSALVHELGHLVGLDHNCYNGIGERAIDDQGNEVPDCKGAPYGVTSTIMFPSAVGGDPVKRRLSGDETRFVCKVYPGEVLNHVLTCGSNNSPEEESEEIPSQEAGGCSLSGGAAPGGGLPLLGSLAAMAILFARRRRGSRS